jgi:ribonuclease HI
MGYIGGDWTKEQVDGLTVYSEPSIESVLSFMDMQADDMLPSMSDAVQKELEHTNLAQLIIPDLGVAKQQVVVDFMADAVVKNVIEGKQKKYSEEELFGKLKDYFRAKLSEVRDTDAAQAVEIKKILKNFDQLTGLAKQKINALNIITVEESETELDDTASMEKRSYEDNATFKIDGKVTMSGRLRRFFHFIEDAYITPNNTIAPKKAYTADMVERVPFDTVYNTLISLLSGQRADYDQMVKHLKKFRKAYPWLQNVINRLDNASDEVKTEFVVAMSKHYVSMKFIMWSQNKDGSYDLSVYDANANAIARQIEDGWYDNFINNKITVPDPNDPADLILDPRITNRLMNQYEQWINPEKGFAVRDANSLPKMRAEGRKWLEEVGITLDDKAWAEIVGWPPRKFIGLFKNKGGAFRLLYENFKVRGDRPISVNNPLAETAFKRLAEVQAKYSSYVLSNSHRTGNETVYSHALNKYNVKRVRDLKTDISIVDALSNISFSQNSSWLDQLYADHNALDKWQKEKKNNPDLEKPETPFMDAFDLHYMGLEAIKQKFGFDGPEMKQADSAEHEVVKITAFQNKGNGKVYFMYPTMSDKTTMMLVEAIKTKVNITPDGTIDQNMVDLLYEQMILPEINRIHYYQAKGGKVNDAGMEEGWFMFYMVPELNNVSALFNEDGTLKSDLLEKPEYVSIMKEVIKNHVTKLVEEKMEEWKELGIGYIDEETPPAFMDLAYMNSTMSPLAKTRLDKVKYAATDYVANYLLANANMYQMVIGDPAMFFKSGVLKGRREQLAKDTESLYTPEEIDQSVFRNRLTDEERIAMVGDTFLNVGKRLAGDMAPGYDLNDQENNSFKQLFIKDRKVASTVAAFFEKLGLAAAGDYRKIASTDAQEITTLTEHMYILRHTGKMPVALYNTIKNVIDKEIANGNHYYDEAIKKSVSEDDYKLFKSLVFQPLKPVYVNNVIDLDNNIDRRVYIKSSSFALSPSMVKGTELDELRILMEKNGIDRAAFLTAAKVGAPSNKNMPTLVKPEGGFDSEVIADLSNNSEKLHLAVRTLPRAGLRIQQEIPYDADKKEINVGTQERKLLFNNILDLPGMKEKFDRYNKNYQKLFELAARDLEYELGYNNGTIDVRKLRNLLIDEAVKRNYPLNDIYALDIKDDGSFVMPLWASSSSDRIQALLNSIVDNRVRKMTFPGKSLVLATEEGFKFKEWESMKDSPDITFVEGFDPMLGLQPMRVENGEFKPGQILMPFKFLDNNGKALKIDSFIVEKNGKKFLDTTKFDKELLKTFGFRIPTQGHNSMAYFEIVGFLPKAHGDMIVAPKELVVQMGSDFDVDKVYLYMHHTNYSALSEQSQNKLDLLNIQLRTLIDDNQEIFSKENGKLKQAYDKLDYFKATLGKLKKEKILSITSINSDLYVPELGFKAGDRMFTSFRAFFSNVVGTGSFYNPDKVDFIKLKAYARNLMDNDIAKLKRINASSLNEKAGAEHLGAWIKDEQEIQYAKALKQVLIQFNKNKSGEIQKIYDAINKLYDEIGEMSETIKGRKQLIEEIKTIKAEKSPYIKKASFADPIKGLVEKANSVVDLNDYFYTHMFNGEEGTFKINRFSDFLKYNMGINESRDFLMDYINAAVEAGLDKVEAELLRKDIVKQISNYKKSIQNDIIDIHFEVMSDPRDVVQQQIHAPLAYGDLKGGKDLAAKISSARAARKHSDKIFSPLSDSYQKQKFINAMAGRVGGVGVFSLDSVLNSVMQHAYAVSGEQIYLTEQFIFDEESLPPMPIVFGNIRSSGDLSGKYVLGTTKRYKSDVIAAYQSAAVDNEKEQIMDKINVNNYTYDVIRILNQLGFDESVVAPFISQDIIFEYVDKLSKATNSLKEYEVGAAIRVRNELFGQYYGQAFLKASPEEKQQIIDKLVEQSDNIGSAEMMAMIEQGEAYPDYKKKQAALLAKFLFLQPYGIELKKIQSAINTDSAGVGKSIFSSMTKEESIYSLDVSPIVNGHTVLGRYTRFGAHVNVQFNTINGHATKNALLLNNRLWRQLFPFHQDAIQVQMEEILQVTGKMNLPPQAKADYYEKVWKDLKAYLFSNAAALNLGTESASVERRRLLFDVKTGEDTFEHYSLAAILLASKDQEFFKNNAFLNRLRPRLGKGDLPSTVTFNAATAENYDELNLYASFMELLVHPIPIGEFNGKTMTTQDLGRELILYAYMTGGLQEASQYVKYIPVEYLQKIGFAEAMNKITFANSKDVEVVMKKENPYQYSKYTKQFVQHNPGSITRGEVEHFNLVTPEGKQQPITKLKEVDFIAINPDQLEEYTVEREGGEWLTEFISFKDPDVPQGWHLFAYVGGNEYERIPVLGTRFIGKKHVASIREYSWNTESSSVVNNDTRLKDAKKVRNSQKAPAPAKVIKAITPSAEPNYNQLIEELELGDGSLPVIKDVLENIKSLTTNLGYREYAENILDIIDKTGIEWSISVIDDPTAPYLARTTYGTNNKVNIIINASKAENRSMLEEVVLHELTHGLTTDLIHKYRINPNQLTAQQKTIIARLSKLQETYRKAVLDEYGLSQDTDVKAYIKTNGDNLTREEASALYGAHNLREFFALGMTSPAFQEKLNDKGLFEKFVELISDLLKAIGITFSDEVSANVVKDITTLIESRIEANIKQPEQKQPIQTQARFSSPDKPLQVFVDGSDIKQAGKLGFGVYLKHGDKEHSISGHYNKFEGGLEKMSKELGEEIKGDPSNGVMELYGSLVAIQNTPSFEFVQIYQDLEGVQLWILSRIIMRVTDNTHLSEKGYKDFWKTLTPKQQEEIHQKVSQYVKLDKALLDKKIYGNEAFSKGNFAGDNNIRIIADKLVDEIMKRPGKVSYYWVRGHSGVQGNEAVDAVAKDVNDYNTFGELFNSQPQVTANIDPNVLYYEGDIIPDAKTVFVFGSNPEGRHGAGAAKIAVEKFGAKYGQGEGLQGNAYALPTKDLRVKDNKGLKSIPPQQIVNNIKKLYAAAKNNPDKSFKVAYRNVETKSLNGYTGLEMMDMFIQAGPIPGNVVFSKEWVNTGKFYQTTKSQLVMLSNKNKEQVVDVSDDMVASGTKRGHLRLIFKNEEVFIPHNELPQVMGFPVTSNPRPWLAKNRPDLLAEYDTAMVKKQEAAERLDMQMTMMKELELLMKEGIISKKCN